MADKILFLSLYEPSKTGEHIGGPVILANDILKVTDPGLNVDLLVYEKDKIMYDLPEYIKFISWSKLASRTKKRNVLSMLPKNLYHDVPCYTINVQEYDKIIYYPYFAALFNLKNCNAQIYTIGMDSGPMIYLRGFVRHKNLITRAFCLYGFMQALSIDRKAAEVSEKVFTVGKADAEFYRSVYLVNAKYIPHPITPLIDNIYPIEWKRGEKLRLCFPGGLTRYYASGLMDNLINLFIKRAEKLKNKIQISFLGRIRYKQLKHRMEKLSSLGVAIEYTEFAENFEEYLSKQHVILLPLVNGGGTKNKTLSSLGMGLDMIGTSIAMENVYGVKKEHVAETAEEFIKLIDLRISQHRLFGLETEEVQKLKAYHSVNKWRKYFWNEIQ